MRYIDVYTGMGVGQQWGFLADSNGTTRPAATNNGVSITPAQNAFGSYTNVLSSIAQDTLLLEITFQSGAVSAQARDILANISTDGGTSVLIQGLSASSAGAGTDGPGITYLFPLWLPAGTTLSCAGSVNNATVGTFACRIRAYGAPRNPRIVRAGRFVRSFGLTLASSRGTTVVSGTAAEGAYATLGTTAEPLWFWQQGFFYNQATSNNFVNYLDLAVNDGVADNVVIADQFWRTTSGEAITNQPVMQAEFYAPKNSTVKARMQSSGAIAADTSIAAYGVGG